MTNYIKTLHTDVSKGFDSKVCNCPADNPKCIHNTGDSERAELLKEYVDHLPIDDIFLMPLGEDGKKPIIKGKCKLDSDRAKYFLKTPKQAIDLIEKEGWPGFVLYAGKKRHGTSDICFVDFDKPKLYDPSELPKTLTVMSGSGGYHKTFWNYGVQNANGKGKLHKVGEIRADNWYVVLPGSVHPSGGIYHTIDSNSSELSGLSPDLLPEELLPALSTNTKSKSTTVPNQDLEFNLEETSLTERDKSILEYGKGRWNQRYKFKLLLTGQYRKAGFIANDGSADRSEAEFILAEKLGYLLKDNFDKINSVILDACEQNKKTTDGQVRKWLERGDTYRKEKLIESCDHDEYFNLSKAQLRTSPYTSLRYEQRPKVSHPTKEKVIMALGELGYGSTADIAEHERVDRSQKQIRRALKELIEKNDVKKGSFVGEYYYYIFETDLPSYLQ